MPRRIRELLAGIGLQIAGWSLAGGMFVLIRFFGIESTDAFQGMDVSQLDRGFLLMQGTLGGGAVGLTFGLLDLWLSRPRFRQMPYGWLILGQSALHLTMIVLVLAAIRAVGIVGAGETFDVQLWASRVASTNLLVLLLYSGLVSVVFNFVKHVNRKFGPGNLVKLLLGRYYRPREEERVFMFLDLQASTTLAEKLGHVLYSRLIQDCFRDLAVVVQNRAEVYQYVGDEAVLCWEMERGLEDLNCLKAFFSFDEQIRARQAHYLEMYGVVPNFKAGANSGLVTVAEVGEIKREIAFHGDVLNTAARIQSKCNDLGQRLLISDYLMKELVDTSEFRFDELGTVELRGRSKNVKIYGVQQVAALDSAPVEPAATESAPSNGRAGPPA